MANDALFQALAQARANPSHAYRAVTAGADAVKNTIGGYMQGKALQQQLDQYRLLNTPLGSMYPDQSQIPFGLGPQHTVKDLLTIAPAMENYVPSTLIRGAAQSFGAPTNDGSAPPPPTNPPPITGSANPDVPRGTTDLQDIQGPGSGGAPNLPPGTSPTVLGNSTSQPTISVPSGGMGMKGFQNIVLPALKAGQEERQFREGHAQTAQQFATTQANEDRRQQERLEAERNRTMASETSKIAPSLTTSGTIQDDINALRPLFKGYSPVPFTGNALATITARSGSSTFGTATMQKGKQIQQIVPALAAKVNYELNRRFNAGEAQMLQQQVIPNAGDDEANANQKISNLQRLTAVMQGGDIQALQMVASAIAGRPVNATLPSSSASPQPAQGQNPPNRSTGDPDADAAIQRIISSNLNPQAKQARINAVRARSMVRG